MDLQKVTISIFLTASLLFGCSASLKGGQAVHPEILTSPDSQRHTASRVVKGTLDAPFNKSWVAVLDVLKHSGFSIQKAAKEDGQIRTFEKEFQGPSYPWRERYHVFVIPNDQATTIKIDRKVWVYRPLLLLGPSVWSARFSNGEREAQFIEQISDRLHAGGTEPSDH
jgi:hypothetical protein